MLRSLALLVAVGATALTVSPASAANRSFPIAGFSKLRVEGPYTVRVHTGAAVSVNAHGPQAWLDKLVVERKGDTLVVSTERGWHWNWMSWGKEETVYVDIGVPMLTAADLTGSGDVLVDRVKTAAFSASVTGSGDLTVSHLETGNLTAGLTGSGDLTVSGRADSASAAVRGSGDIHAAGLTVGKLEASVTGSGDLSVGPAEIANVSVTGSGDLTVAGHPRCTTHKTGSGDIRCGG